MVFRESLRLIMQNAGLLGPLSLVAQGSYDHLRSELPLCHPQHTLHSFLTVPTEG